MLTTALAAAIVLLLAPVLATVLIVDDWSRDLTTNTATTSAESADPGLRPLQTEASAEQLADALRSFANQNGAWELVESSGNSHKLVRTTGLLRFKDDVVMTFSATDNGLLVEASSGSRVGKGDLGQNPRNLKELLSGLSERLPVVSTGS
ncbi:MAG: DUF1499 domain-containing protein [Planctomycetota bacterium]